MATIKTTLNNEVQEKRISKLTCIMWCIVSAILSFVFTYTYSADKQYQTTNIYQNIDTLQSKQSYDATYDNIFFITSGLQADSLLTGLYQLMPENADLILINNKKIKNNEQLQIEKIRNNVDSSSHYQSVKAQIRN